MRELALHSKLSAAMGIGEAFEIFVSNLNISNGDSISYRYKRITRQLNRDFYGYEDETYHSMYTGSYGRDTAIAGFSDLDMLFWLPSAYFAQYDSHQGNGQSAMLQAVRNSIRNTYPSSEVSGDGQVVVISFDDGMRFEIAPGFELTDNSFKCPNSNGGGSWYITNPRAERDEINVKNLAWNSSLKRLARMGRAWKRTWDVPIGGLLIDTFAYNFLETYAFRDKAFYYFDWMSRDFFDYMAVQNSEQQYWLAPGSRQYVWRKGLFEWKARRCCNLAIEAIEADSKNYEYTRNSKWREVYGTSFPS